MKTIFYIDLDRTLFQTSKMDVVWRYIAAHYSVEVPTDVWRFQQDFFVATGDMYYYDMSAQLRALGLDSPSVYAAIIHSELADGRFEFDGCRSLVSFLNDHFEVRVITYGADDIQRFKAALCPSLAGVTIMTTLKPKRDFFAALKDQLWMVDDKAIWRDVPKNVRFIQVSLEGKSIKAPTSSWPIFTTLSDVESYVRREYTSSASRRS